MARRSNQAPKSPRESVGKRPTTRPPARTRRIASGGIASPAPARLIAVVDVGSRALRMAVSEVSQGGSVRCLETLSVPIAIGVETFSRGRIRAATMDALVESLGDFAKVLETYRLVPADCRAVATTAVRDARNREILLDRVEKRTGFRIEIIEAIEETRLMHQLIQALVGRSLNRGSVLLLAIGAGGTHVVLQRDGEIQYAETLHFGMLRLRTSGGGRRAEVSATRHFLHKVVDSIDRLHALSTADRMIVLNSEMSHLVASLARPRRVKVGLTLSDVAVQRLGKRLEQMAIQDLAEQTRVGQATAELARMAFEEAWAFFKVAGPTRLLLPDCTMIDSLFLDTRLRLDRQREGSRHSGRMTEASAWSVARRYRVDEVHVAKVRDLALQLFDGLRTLLGLGDGARLLLSVAAILHNVGLFVSSRQQAEHSAYLVANSEIMGLTREDLGRVALVVRHHRGHLRGVESVDLPHLKASERVEVLKLVVLLRLADALDADHRQRVCSVRVRTTDDELQVTVETRSGDRESFLDLERAFQARSDLVDDLFGLTPRLLESLAV